MDVYHKILRKVYGISGGKETVEIDLKDLIKKEGFFANIDNITEHLTTESWVTETSGRYVVKMTHWGVAEAKRVLSDTPETSRAMTNDTNRLVADTRELVILLEEFAAVPSGDKLKMIEKRFLDLAVILDRIKANT